MMRVVEPMASASQSSVKLKQMGTKRYESIDSQVNERTMLQSYALFGLVAADRGFDFETYRRAGEIRWRGISKIFADQSEIFFRLIEKV
jgi:hypothetical protein